MGAARLHQPLKGQLSQEIWRLAAKSIAVPIDSHQSLILTENSFIL